MTVAPTSLGDIISSAELVASGSHRASGLTLSIPDTWMQGRTTYGGLSTVIALEAARARLGAPPPLRSAQISFVGPVAGRVDVTTELLRQGRSTAFVAVDVRSGLGLGARAVFVFAHDLESQIDFNDMMSPPAPEPEGAAAAFTKPRKDFLQNLEIRHATGRDAEREPRFLRWVRLRDRAGVDPTTALLAVGDALPPAVLAAVDNRGPISTMTWSVAMLDARPQTHDGWWLVSSTAKHARQGYSSQSMMIWNADRQPVLAGMQSVALFM